MESCHKKIFNKYFEPNVQVQSIAGLILIRSLKLFYYIIKSSISIIDSASFYNQITSILR